MHTSVKLCHSSCLFMDSPHIVSFPIIIPQTGKKGCTTPTKVSGPPKWSVYVCCTHLDRCHSNDGECPPLDRMTSMSSMCSVDLYGCVCIRIQTRDFNNRGTIVPGWGGVPGFILCTKPMRTSLKNNVQTMGKQWEVPDWRCLHVCVCGAELYTRVM